MNHKLLLDRFEGDMAVFITEDGSRTINWPKDLLPADAKEGDLIYFNLQNEEETSKGKKETAKDILNEILNKEDVDENISP